jgi:hypothetical protein
MAGIVCGYDRWPSEHFFCNVCASLSADDTDEPLWASIFDNDLSRVSSADGFDMKLSSFGITLPDVIKAALRSDWSAQEMKRELVWNSAATIIGESK